MRRQSFLLLLFYLVFLGGGVYYNLLYPLRYAHHGVMTILLGLWLAGRIRQGKGLPNTPLNSALYVLVGVWLVSALVGWDARMSLERVWYMVVHVLLFFVMVDLIQRGRQRQMMEAQFILAALVILISLLEIASWYFGLGIIPGTDVGWIEVAGPGAWLPLIPPRLSLALGISTWLGGYVAPLVTVAAAWALTARQRDFRGVLWLLAAALLVVLILTFSRGGWVSLLAAVGTVIALRVLHRVRMEGLSRRVLLVGGGVLAAMVIAGVISVALVSRTAGRATGDSQRLDLWSSAVEMVRDHPVLGVGTGMYGRALRTYRNPAIADDGLAAAHNLYLNTAAEIGFVGVAVGLWLAFLTVRVWRRNWQQAPTPAARTRQEMVCAALVGVAAHSVVDTFTVTSVVSVYLLLLAYSVANYAAPVPQAERRWTAWGALALVAVYGLAWVAINRADLDFRRSLPLDADQLAQARSAATGDPALNLYDLQVYYLMGRGDDLDAAIAAYEQAVALEPTWETGWLNLAALEEMRGNPARALEHLAVAKEIFYQNPGALHWARVAEASAGADEEAIIEAYIQAMIFQTRQLNRPPMLPLAAFWAETPLRVEALRRYMDTVQADFRYRMMAAHFPDERAAQVPEAPATAAEWWVMGEYALTVLDDPSAAVGYFDWAVALEPFNGDYYVSRGRARAGLDREAAIRDLKTGKLLLTRLEYPNAILAELSDDPEEQRRLRITALSPRGVVPDFEAVLFDRTAGFDILPQMRFPGPGTAIMQPWYRIAEQYESMGDRAAALRAYEVILDYAPDERRAQIALGQG